MGSFSKYSCVLFDLDGTLTDSAPGILNCLRYSLAKMGIEEKDESRLRSFIGPSLRDTYQNVYNMTAAEAAQATEYYRERFTSGGNKENSLFDGVAELLADLKKSGRSVALATAKPTVQAVVILQHFGIDGCFAGVFGSNLDGTRENKAEIIACALSELGIAPGAAVMVGDRHYDIRGAKENSLAAIGALYGYGGEGELQAAGADALAGSVAELRDLLL